jgi:hypothetical protein
MPQGLIEDSRASQPSSSNALVKRSETDSLALQHTRHSFDDDENSSDEAYQYRTYKLPGRAQTQSSHAHHSHKTDTREHRSSEESKGSGSGSLFDRVVDGVKLLASEYTSLVRDRAEATTAGNFKDVKTRYLKTHGLRKGEWLSSREMESRKDCDTATCSHMSRRRIYTLEEKKGKWHDKWSTRCRSVSRANGMRRGVVSSADYHGSVARRPRKCTGSFPPLGASDDLMSYRG